MGGRKYACVWAFYTHCKPRMNRAATQFPL